jgi:uncharacterized protein YggU (UPF0235/DUF167 family)
MNAELVRVEVTPGARKESFVERDKNTFVVSVKEKAERNAANTRVRELLAMHFGTPLKAIRIVSGHRGKKKLVRVLQ